MAHKMIFEAMIGWAIDDNDNMVIDKSVTFTTEEEATEWIHSQLHDKDLTYDTGRIESSLK